jgi:hypothetical protein
MTVAFVKHSAYGDGHNSGHDDSQERPDHSQQNIEHHEHEQCGNEPLADLLRGDATAADADLATGI